MAATYSFYQGDQINLAITVDAVITLPTDIKFVMQRNGRTAFQKTYLLSEIALDSAGTLVTVTLIEADTSDLAPGEYEAQGLLLDSSNEPKVMALTDSDGLVVDTIEIKKRLKFT